MTYRLIFIDGSSREILEPSILETSRFLADQIEDFSDSKDLYLPPRISHSLMELYQLIKGSWEKLTPNQKQKVVIHFNDLLILANKLMDENFVGTLKIRQRQLEIEGFQFEIDLSLPLSVLAEYYKESSYEQIPPELNLQEEFFLLWASLSRHHMIKKFQIDLQDFLKRRFPFIKRKKILSSFILHWLDQEPNQEFNLSQLHNMDDEFKYSGGQAIYLDYTKWQGKAIWRPRSENLYMVFSADGSRKIQFTPFGIHFLLSKEKNHFLSLNEGERKQEFLLNQDLFVFEGYELIEIRSIRPFGLSKTVSDIRVSFSNISQISELTVSKKNEEKENSLRLWNDQYLIDLNIELILDGKLIVYPLKNSSFTNFFQKDQIEVDFSSKKNLPTNQSKTKMLSEGTSSLVKTVFSFDSQKHIFESLTTISSSPQIDILKEKFDFFSKNMVNQLLNIFMKKSFKRIYEGPDHEPTFISISEDTIFYQTYGFGFINKGYHFYLIEDEGYENRIELINLQIRFISQEGRLKAFFDGEDYPFCHQGKVATIFYDSEYYNLKISFSTDNGFLEEFEIYEKESGKQFITQIDPRGMIVEKSLSSLISIVVDHSDYRIAHQ